MTLWNVEDVDVVVLVASVPLVDLLHYMLRKSINGDLRRSPLRVSVEAVLTSVVALLLASLIEERHDFSQIEDVVVR